MKIILSESQIRKLTSEQFDSREYDRVLDKYNELGMDGLTDKEIIYLKSGGESEIPSQKNEQPPKSNEPHYEEILDKTVDETTIKKLGLVKQIMDKIDHDIDLPKDELKDDFSYIISFKYNEVLYKKLSDWFNSGDNSEFVDSVFLEDGKIIMPIPFEWAEFIL